MLLYSQHGLKGVTIAEITRIAEVAPRTFFGYFEAKEDVFLGRGDERLEQLVQAIQNRDRGEPILTAVRRALRHESERSRPARGRPELAELLDHPAIASRLRERWTRWEDMLAEAIAADVRAAPADPEPRVLAAAITGAIRVAAASAGRRPRRRQEIADRAFDMLVDGLSKYGAERGI
jgi:AcrR family transcriptional regulator